MFKKTFREGNKVVYGKFNKLFENEDYIVCFNTETGFEVLQGKNGEDPFATELPLLVDVGIMGSCLNKCSFCYQGDKDEPHMTLENFKSIIDQLKHHTNQVALGGRGDPNLHPDFEAIVNYARDNGVVPNYTTSGRNLTDEQIEISKVCGAVAVSDYERDFTYNAIDRLINAGIKTNIHLIYSRPNHVKAMHIITGDDVWDGQVNMDKLNALIFLLFKPQGSGAKRLDLIPETHHIQDFARIVFSPKAKFKIGMDSCLINHVLGYSTPNDIQRMAVDTCESGRMSVYISPSMELIPCSFADHSKWGTKIIDKQGINGIWNDSILFKIFRNKLKIAPNECPLGL